ncbi:RNA-directed DNA methylation 4 isoform X2 [Primulina eburnea]|uniref:RNA-directed DNA methylation 4 isoform X2 n=1 Tax=Primulina eburnea TaxID=1245227 RepID=UPI003C6C75B4
MAAVAESSSLVLKNDKPVIVRVKRKAFQHRVDAFWLEINERPLKRALLDFEKLSVSESSSTREELKTTKILVHHVETVTSSENTIDVLRSFVPNSSDAWEHGGENEERRRKIKTVNKQDELLVKAKRSQEVLSRNARYEQIWRSRKGKQDSQEHEMCRLYDIVKIDVNEQEMKVKQMDTNLGNHEMMAEYLPLLREVLPTAASEIETDIQDYVSIQGSSDDYVYDFYAVTNDGNVYADSTIQYPLVQVDDDDDYYDGPDNSDYETDDSNAENNPLNDYPDEDASEEDDVGDDEVTSRSSDEESEDESRTSGSRSQSLESERQASNEDDNSGPDYWSDDADQLPEDEMYSEGDVDNNSGYEWR